MKEDPHGGWRRVVPSPRPYSIVETPVVKRLVADGVIVIAGGGGGVPVIEKGPRLIGKEGVVDKDLAAAILAAEVEASTLLILTDVKKVQRGFGTPLSRGDRADDHRRGRGLLKRGEFGAGSMGPKVQAAIDFLETGGKRVMIGDLDEAPAILRGEAGTDDRAVVSPPGSGSPPGTSTDSARAWRPWPGSSVMRRSTSCCCRSPGRAGACGRSARPSGWSSTATRRAFPRRRVQNAVLVAAASGRRSHRLVRFDGGSLVHPRGALIARRRRRHGGLGPPRTWTGAERGHHVEQLLGILDGIDEPLRGRGRPERAPEDAVTATIAAVLPDVWTRVGGSDGGIRPRSRQDVPCRHVPTARIDYLFTGPAFRPLRVWTAGGTVSDHLMVVADLQIARSSAEDAALVRGSGRAGSP